MGVGGMARVTCAGGGISRPHLNSGLGALRSCAEMRMRRICFTSVYFSGGTKVAMRTMAFMLPASGLYGRWPMRNWYVVIPSA